MKNYTLTLLSHYLQKSIFTIYVMVEINCNGKGSEDICLFFIKQQKLQKKLSKYYSHNLVYFISLLNKIRNHGLFRSSNENLLNHHFLMTDWKWTCALGKQQWVRTGRNRFLIALHKNRKVYSITKPKFWSFLKKKIIRGHVLLVQFHLFYHSQSLRRQMITFCHLFFLKWSWEGGRENW